jgi:hypothetical protein
MTAFETIVDMFDTAEHEVRDGGGAYWQGRKDGLRLAITLLAEEEGREDEAKFWRSFQASSPASRVDKITLLLAILNSAIYYVGMFLAHHFNGDEIDRRSLIYCRSEFWAWQSFMRDNYDEVETWYED